MRERSEIDHGCHVHILIPTLFRTQSSIEKNIQLNWKGIRSCPWIQSFGYPFANDKDGSSHYQNKITDQLITPVESIALRSSDQKYLPRLPFGLRARQNTRNLAKKSTNANKTSRWIGTRSSSAGKERNRKAMAPDLMYSAVCAG